MAFTCHWLEQSLVILICKRLRADDCFDPAIAMVSSIMKRRRPIFLRALITSHSMSRDSEDVALHYVRTGVLSFHH